MKIQHTPKPWVIKGNDAINAGPIQIAYFLNDRIGIKEAKANACIIAAAPELLEACEILQRICGIQANLASTASDTDKKRFIGMVYELCNEIVNPAIAKARGAI